jgi:Na+-transporting NADH:ubiquinone oxidoreductase subunit NqrC
MLEKIVAAVAALNLIAVIAVAGVMVLLAASHQPATIAHKQVKPVAGYCKTTALKGGTSVTQCTN